MTDPTFALVPLWQIDNARLLAQPAPNTVKSYCQAIDKILKSWLDARIQVLN